MEANEKDKQKIITNHKSFDECLQHARDTTLKFCSMLTCQACHGEFLEMNEKCPWRSKNCEHLFCFICASYARGDMTLNRRMNNANNIIGKCPVVTCQVPVGPIDIVQDISTGQIVDACSNLFQWATHDDKQDKEEKEIERQDEINSQGENGNNENFVLDGRRLFEDEDGEEGEEEEEEEEEDVDEWNYGV